MGLLNKHNLNINKFCSSNDSRPELKGVFIEPNRTTATDSFSLVSVSIPIKPDTTNFPEIPNQPKPQANFKPFIMPKEKAEELTKYLSKKASVPIMEFLGVVKSSENIAEVLVNGTTGFEKNSFNIITGKYPEFNEILLEKGSYEEITINPEYLKKMADYFIKFSDKFVKIKIPSGKDKKRPIRFEGENTLQKATGLIMPIDK